MEKQEYLNKVGNIYKNLVHAIAEYNGGLISIKVFQVWVRDLWNKVPKEYQLVDEELAESLELDESYIGQVINIEDVIGSADMDTYKEWVEQLIDEIPNWKKDSGKFSVRGSNSLIPNIIGEPEWKRFAFGYNC